MRRGKLFIISAPSGTGKTTLAEKLLRKDKQLVRSVSVTTRAARRGERQGRDYFFVTQKEFLRRRAKGRFLECAKVFGHYYGTPRRFVMQKTAQGRDVVACLDVQGARQVRKKWPGAVSVFVLPPKTKDLLERLKKRKTDSPRQMRARLKMARWELAQSKEYDYKIVNDQLKQAESDLRMIIAAEREN